MRSIINDDFLLTNRTAARLYHEHAARMPIIDYHCHIDPYEIYNDRRYGTITGLWLGGDHYKWRAMRACGVAERFITGNAAPDEKFRRWAETVPQLIGNPLYHWTHLELKRYFDVDEALTGKNADAVFAHCNEVLKKEEMGARGIIQRSNVRLICTTDDPADALEAHQKLAAERWSTAVLPAFRPDLSMRADKPGFVGYIGRLEAVLGKPIETMDDMRDALIERIDYFDRRGCRLSDHALDHCFCEPAGEAELAEIFKRARGGESIAHREQLAYHTEMLRCAGREYARRGWVMQLHFGCIRDNSSRMYRALGPDTGFDAINDLPNASGLARFLDLLDAEAALPRTILYSLNPNDNAVINTVMGCFQHEAGIAGKLQHGSAWWFNDHKHGMESQLRDLMSMGAIGGFVGMLTDSRSFLSYTRHEYFRRILCNLVGDMVEKGEYPADMETLGRMVENISYSNCLRYFRFDEVLDS